MSIQSVLGLKNANNRSEKEAADVIEKIDRHANHLLDLPKRIGYGVERVKITPELAKHYLTFNRNNWDLITARVSAYADEMVRGEWAENGESIKFSKNGRLIDGQHRLYALLKAGVTLHMLVVYGCEEEVQVKIDIGRTKTARGVLTVQGLASWEARTVGTAIHALINVAAGLPLSSNVKRLNREVENFYLDNQLALQATVKFVAELPRKTTPITHAKAVTLHYLFSKKDVATADAFIEKLFTGDSLARSSPVYQLRERLNEAQRADAQSLSTRQQLHACIKAWNYLRAHKSLTTPRSLMPRSDEPLPEIE